ncbi:WD40 repeat domain-containing serine/threonine protein kinase [Urbifossiella limnaea]|uniref:WD40 repeat domain-containing serine/threonine protein kinase n=1 Tax=Urbifossiella limnaea TaxID=2528023 RepID=UPI00192E683B|nr:serine/threonine-protein kinase [Urbifossiella limnaea]
MFLAALDRPTPADRAAFLADACGTDAALRARVERLLAADSGAGILDAAVRPVRPLVAGGTFAVRYRLVRRLGAGGMGEVWAADQTAPVRRPVALKVIRPGLDPAALLARFELERQALAVMDHPHIARVFDAGVADGLPYLAMELVAGEPVTAYCDARRLAVRRRLALFVPVCRAVQHAHQKGVIHRDLKPANVLVAEVDGAPAPKVIDFGIAKPAGLDAGDGVRTGRGVLVGTPEYMAPEQAGGALDVDTRADVYALGVLLYELLTGVPPIRAAGPGAAGLLELLRAVREDDPPPPGRLRPELRGDLDAVVMKALEKDRARRYDTAADLARDVERVLAGEPVAARPVGRVERGRRWARRNPAVAGLLAVVAVLLLTVAVGASAFAVRLRDALNDSESARKDTRRQLWQAQLSRADATAQGGLPGQRTASLALLREALGAARELGLTDADRAAFRDVAVAVLGLPDLEVEREWDGYPPGTRHVAADAKLERYARADQSGAVSVRRVADDVEVCALPGGGKPVRVTLSDDGRSLAVVDSGGAGRVFHLDGATPKPLFAAGMDPARAPHFSPDGGRLVFVAGATLRSWDRATGEVWSWPLPGRAHGGSALSADGRLVAVGCAPTGPAVLHVRAADGADYAETLPLTGAAESVAWHPGGRVVAVFTGRRVRLLEVPGGRALGVLDGHRADGGRVAFDAAGDRLFSNDWLGLLRVWDWRGGRQLLTLPAAWPDHDRMTAAGDRLFVHGATPSTLRVVRCEPGRERQALGRPPAAGHDPTPDPLGRFVLVSGDRGTAALAPDTGEERGRLKSGHRPFLLSQSLLLTSGTDGPHRWPRADDAAARVTRFGPPEWLGPPVSGGAETHGASADGRVVAVPNHSAGAVVLHTAAPWLVAPTGPQEFVRTCAVSPYGRWVATGSGESPTSSGARVWDARTGAPVYSFPVPGLCPVGFSPCGRWLVTGGGGLRVWHVGTWADGPALPGAASAVGWAFTPGGDILAVGGHGEVRLVRPADGAELARLPLPGLGKFQPRAFSADGGRLYVTDLETSGVVTWDVRRLRRGLSELGLDWDTPPIPAEGPAAAGWRVEFVGVDRLGRPWAEAVKAAEANWLDVGARARLAATSKTPAESLLHAGVALGLDPTRLDARLYRARAALQLRQFDAAAADAAAVLAAVPGHLDATRVRDAAGKIPRR